MLASSAPTLAPIGLGVRDLECLTGLTIELLRADDLNVLLLLGVIPPVLDALVQFHGAWELHVPKSIIPLQLPASCPRKVQVLHLPRAVVAPHTARHEAEVAVRPFEGVIGYVVR